ncbi:histone H3.v1-like isoform X2 [Patiria miniata]|uniref:WW domain-containing protein n=1 Tax=Patiria miniata TaxID=46514 RepID=A0A913ZNK4_PATMI|nr:histone H3.v1-like isoform X2 [Patiria miniata]
MDANFQRGRLMQDLHPGAGVWWANMPLPPGWEAKYDHNAKKYFFIHHATRSTQWVDPRKAFYEQQRGGGIAPGPSPRMPYGSPRMPHSSPRMPMHAGPAIPMQPISKPKCKTCKTNEVPSANQDCQACQLKARQREAELVRAREEAEAERKRQENQQRIQKEQERRRVQSAARSRTPVTSHTFETSFNTEPEAEQLTAGQKRAIIESLDDAFPGVERNVVEMVLETSSWDSGKATSVLMSMGPKDDKKKTAMASAARAATKPKAPSPPKASSPKHPSAAMKQKMLDNLKKMFPSASETLIELALETTQYNQARATQVLRMTVADERGSQAKKSDTKAKTTARATTPSNVTFSISSAGSSGASATTRVTDAQPKASAPVSFGVTSSVSKPSPPSSFASASPGTVSAPSTSLPSTPAASRQAKAAARAKGAARRTRSAERAPREEFLSHFSSATQGPDGTLVHGPNKNNLLETYVSFKGSDRSIVHGPRKENVAGPARREGHNPSLAVGSQNSHYTGAQASLAKGSMRAADRQM